MRRNKKNTSSDDEDAAESPDTKCLIKKRKKSPTWREFCDFWSRESGRRSQGVTGREFADHDPLACSSGKDRSKVRHQDIIIPDLSNIRVEESTHDPEEEDHETYSGESRSTERSEKLETEYQNPVEEAETIIAFEEYGPEIQQIRLEFKDSPKKDVSGGDDEMRSSDGEEEGEDYWRPYVGRLGTCGSEEYLLIFDAAVSNEMIDEYSLQGF